jgi:hypothetical protein
MKKFIALSAITLASFASHADVRVNGFANLVSGITTASDETVFGYDDSISFLDESVFAIQISGDINSKMTATGQIVARGTNDYEAEFEWAYMAYQATDKLTVSAGRLRVPLFRYSASSDVGYSYHWVTAPRSVYDVGFSNIDGAKLDYSSYAGDWEYNLQGVFGTNKSEFADGILSGKDLLLFSAEATYEWFKARGVYGTNVSTYARDDIDETIEILNTLGLSDLADDMYMRDDRGTFIGLGLEIDTFTYFASAEITVTENENTFTAKSTAFYATAGMRVGKFTPSVTFERLEDDDEIKYTDQLVGLSAAILPTATAIVTGIQQSAKSQYDLVTFGVRYELDPSIALKADVSTYTDNINDDSDGTLIRFAVNYVF